MSPYEALPAMLRCSMELLRVWGADKGLSCQSPKPTCESPFELPAINPKWGAVHSKSGILAASQYRACGVMWSASMHNLSGADLLDFVAGKVELPLQFTMPTIWAMGPSQRSSFLLEVMMKALAEQIVSSQPSQSSAGIRRFGRNMCAFLRPPLPGTIRGMLKSNVWCRAPWILGSARGLHRPV